jgi:1-deoxy-D-xylulose-5-phosphate reductoisomerase
LAFDALNSGGTAPCILNAANEVAVSKFLQKEIKFSHIPLLINKALDKVENNLSPIWERYLSVTRSPENI